MNIIPLPVFQSSPLPYGKISQKVEHHKLNQGATYPLCSPKNAPKI